MNFRIRDILFITKTHLTLSYSYCRWMKKENSIIHPLAFRNTEKSGVHSWWNPTLICQELFLKRILRECKKWSEYESYDSREIARSRNENTYRINYYFSVIQINPSSSLKRGFDFFVVGMAGLEPATFALKGRCSTYWATFPYVRALESRMYFPTSFIRGRLWISLHFIFYKVFSRDRYTFFLWTSRII